MRHQEKCIHGSLRTFAASSHVILVWGGLLMKKFANSVKKFLVSEDGPTAVEYAVMLALIIVVCLASISTIGTAANSKFDAVGDYLS
jgi:pilus assembly protein Flp/PilA